MKDKQIELNPEEKFAAIGNIRDNLAEKFLELGQILSEIKSAKLYHFKGYENFKDFLAAEYNLSTDLANKLMRIQRIFLDEMDMDETTLLEIGYDRLGMICAAVDKADWQSRDELVAQAQELPLNDLKAYLKSKREEEAKADTDLKRVFVDQWLERMISGRRFGRRGSITEDADKYEFVTRDPQTNRCLVCNGKGHVYPTKMLPTGHVVSTLVTQQKRLNVSRKAVIHLELPDTGVGYGELNTEEKQRKAEKSRETEVPIFKYWDYNQLPERLNKVLEEGKHFLIVTNTEPYYHDVYRMIRNQEKLQGTWTEADEDLYVESLENAISILRATKEANNG